MDVVLDLSDIVKAYDIRGIAAEELDEPTVREIGAAFARFVGEGDEKASGVALAHDMRSSSPGLAAAFAEGVTAQGLDVVWLGLASTDMLYFAAGYLDRPGVMFTASHNPPQYNGIKLCRAGAAPIGQDSGLEEIRRSAEQGVPPGPGGGKVTERDVLADYARYLRGLVDLGDIRPLSVVVDAGNGMAGHTVPTVLSGLPIELTAMYFELDGTFPNHEANPLVPANTADLREKVRHLGADIGLAFDGDADRCAVVDERGEEVSPSAITALVAVRELGKAPGAAVIHNLITSRAVPEIVAEHGGHPVRSRVGHSFIKAEMATTGAIFGGEHSAHYYFRDFWRADTGMLAALHVFAALGGQSGPLSALAADYSRYAASGEINSTVDDPAAKLAQVKEAFSGEPGAEIDELDGLTVSFEDGSWFNLRPSNTEPLLRCNAEAADRQTVDELTERVLGIVRG
jgi:phosphomannomutase